ncbi:hypothetical protein POTOM_038252 [Populus tomentosa]|uniref:Agenet domain-containing protein n=1 Tax=Populus tomentosa TaxID=118781 RepID=A0A8X7Z0H3_POPTO|nr:hypothetical protein POTOM_038252 [Populus tomentosa]
MSHLSRTPFNKGDRVEVLKRENGPRTLTYYPATVVKSNKNQFFIEYQTLMVESNSNGPKRVSEFVDLGYVVGFDGQCSEGIVSEQCNLRLHREWDDGSWIPPLLDQIMLKIKCRLKKPDPVGEAGDRMQQIFRHGALVDVKSDEEGYDGSWFGAIIVGPVERNAFLVQYLNLVTEDETAPLREIVTEQNIRLNPPEKTCSTFSLFPVKDISYKLRPLLVCNVRIANQMQMLMLPKHSHHTRISIVLYTLHLTGESIVLEGTGRAPKPKFSKGTRVEGFQGSWYSATIVEVMENVKFLVQYHNLVTDDETGSLREEAGASDIRPSRPRIQHAYAFKLSEIVDAWYDDGWWMGCIVKVHNKLKNTVHFKTTEELEFGLCELPHQEWIDRNWFAVPKICSLYLH